jgi:hypothetical protein
VLLRSSRSPKLQQLPQKNRKPRKKQENRFSEKSSNFPELDQKPNFQNVLLFLRKIVRHQPARLQARRAQRLHLHHQRRRVRGDPNQEKNDHHLVNRRPLPVDAREPSDWAPAEVQPAHEKQPEHHPSHSVLQRADVWRRGCHQWPQLHIERQVHQFQGSRSIGQKV